MEKDKMLVMEKDKMLLVLKVWMDHYNELRNISNKFYDLFGEGAPDVFWKTFDLYTNTLAKLCGDYTDDNWLNWFCFENDMGKKQMEAGFYNDLKKIKTLDDLYELILEGSKC